MKTREFDVVLSDFNIAGFEGLKVVEAVRAHDPRIPVIIVTGTGSEEIAVMALKQGAADYVIKRPKHILRLPQTILAAIEKKALREQRQETETAMKESEEQYRLLVENQNDLVVKFGRDQKMLFVSPSYCETFGVKEENILGRNFFPLIHEDDIETVKASIASLEKPPHTTYHDGHISIESRPEVGTTFHIYLPASEKAVREKKEVKLIKGRGRILVMDDEAPLRKMVGKMLKTLGYESEFAKDGAQAIEIYNAANASQTPYDAVILDLTVPGAMGGKEAIKKLLKIDPEVKAIVSGGYSDDPVLANFQEYGFKGMIPKPFESQSLSKVLHEVLQGKGKD